MKKETPKNQTSKTPEWSTKIIPDDFRVCEHYFELSPGGAKCERCGMGLVGVYQVKNGKPVM